MMPVYGPRFEVAPIAVSRVEVGVIRPATWAPPSGTMGASDQRCDTKSRAPGATSYCAPMVVWFGYVGSASRRLRSY